MKSHFASSELTKSIIICIEVFLLPGHLVELSLPSERV